MRMRGDGLLIDDLGEERQVRLEAHAGPSGAEAAPSLVSLLTVPGSVPPRFLHEP